MPIPDRILVCGLEGSPVAAGTGGIERLLVGWSHGLACLGIDVHVANVGCRVVPCIDGVTGHAVGTLAGVHRLAAELEVDLLSVHNTPSLAVGAPVPTVVTLHNAPPAWIWPRSAPAQSLAGLAAACGVSAVSRFLADRATHAVGGEVTVVTPFADDAFFAATLPASRNPVVLFAGRLVRRKGAGLLPEIARLVRTREPEAEVMATAFDHPLIPDPDVAPLVAELSAAPGVRLVPGLRRSSDLASLYASARVLVVPSMAEEAFGLVSVESQACGTFPVVFADGGLPETLASGRVVPVGAVDRLAAEVALALATWSPDMAIEIRVAARRFSRAASTDAFLEFCAAALTRGRRRPDRPVHAHQPADGADPAGT